MRCMYKAVNKTKAIRRYMEDLSLHTAAPTVHASHLSISRVRGNIWLYIYFIEDSNTK